MSVDTDDKNSLSLIWNHSVTNVAFFSCAAVKSLIITSPIALSMLGSASTLLRFCKKNTYNIQFQRNMYFYATVSRKFEYHSYHVVNLVQGFIQRCSQIVEEKFPNFFGVLYDACQFTFQQFGQIISGKNSNLETQKHAR